MCFSNLGKGDGKTRNRNLWERKDVYEKKENELQIDWKHFYLGVLALVIPMALQNLINVGVTAADVVMLGRVGETALSGSSLAGQVQYIMTLFLFGLTSGATVLTAQYWGKRTCGQSRRFWVLECGLRFL